MSDEVLQCSQRNGGVEVEQHRARSLPPLPPLSLRSLLFHPFSATQSVRACDTNTYKLEHALPWSPSCAIVQVSESLPHSQDAWDDKEGPVSELVKLTPVVSGHMHVKLSPLHQVPPCRDGVTLVVLRRLDVFNLGHGVEDGVTPCGCRSLHATSTAVSSGGPVGVQQTLPSAAPVNATDVRELQQRWQMHEVVDGQIVLRREWDPAPPSSKVINGNDGMFRTRPLWDALIVFVEEVQRQLCVAGSGVLVVKVCSSSSSGVGAGNIGTGTGTSGWQLDGNSPYLATYTQYNRGGRSMQITSRKANSPAAVRR